MADVCMKKANVASLLTSKLIIFSYVVQLHYLPESSTKSLTNCFDRNMNMATLLFTMIVEMAT